MRFIMKCNFTFLKRRKYYVPGFLSLCLLLPLCVWYMNKNDGIDKLLTVNWNNRKEKNEEMEEKTEEIKTRNFIQFNLTGTRSDKEKFRRIQSLVKSIKINKDTLSGVQVHFSARINYSTVVELFDVLEKEKHSTYLLCEDDIWIYFRLKESNYERLMKKRRTFYL